MFINCHFKIAIAVVLSISLLSCTTDENNIGDNKFRCPQTGDDISWESFGSYTLHASGRDATARKIISTCGWHVHQGHNGGFGNTLQVASPDESVILVWAFNSFYGFNLTSGWHGTMPGRIRIGDTVESLFRYPFTTNDGIMYTYKTPDDINVRIWTADATIVRVYVGSYLRN